MNQCTRGFTTVNATLTHPPLNGIAIPNAACQIWFLPFCAHALLLNNSITKLSLINQTWGLGLAVDTIWNLTSVQDLVTAI